MALRKVKITSDGTPWGTAVCDVATGERLDGLVAVRWYMESNGFARAAVEFVNVSIEAVGELPHDGEPGGIALSPGPLHQGHMQEAYEQGFQRGRKKR